MSARAIDTAVRVRNATSSIPPADRVGRQPVRDEYLGAEARRHEDERRGGPGLDERVARRDRFGAAPAAAAKKKPRDDGHVVARPDRVPQFGQAESDVSDRPAGTRYTTTLRNDPIARPKRPAKASSITSAAVMPLLPSR